MQVLLAKTVIDQIISNGNINTVLYTSVVFLLMKVVDSVLNPFSQTLIGELCDLTTKNLNLLILNKAAGIKSLNVIQSPQYQDDIEVSSLYSQSVARDIISSFLALIEQSSSLFAYVILCSNLMGIWAPAAILVSMLPTVFAAQKSRKIRISFTEEQAEDRRRLEDWLRIGVDVVYAKEVRVYSLQQWVQANFIKQSTDIIQRAATVYGRDTKRVLSIGIVSFTGIGAVFFYVLSQIINSKLSVGDISVFVTSIFGLRDTFDYIVGNYQALQHALYCMSHIYSFTSAIDPISNSPSVKHDENLLDSNQIKKLRINTSALIMA
jgi:ABC-type multidrug transport system fused ATPase/permease subunit